MNKLIFIILSLSSAALLLTGCRNISEPDSALPERRSSEIREIRIGNELLKAIRDCDYKKFATHFSMDAGIYISEKDFEASCANMKKEFGKMISFSFMAALETPAVKNLIWKVRFMRKGSNGKIIHQDMLFRLVTGEVDGKICILSFGII